MTEVSACACPVSPDRHHRARLPLFCVPGVLGLVPPGALTHVTLTGRSEFLLARPTFWPHHGTSSTRKSQSIVTPILWTSGAYCDALRDEFAGQSIRMCLSGALKAHGPAPRISGRSRSQRPAYPTRTSCCKTGLLCARMQHTPPRKMGHVADRGVEGRYRNLGLGSIGDARGYTDFSTAPAAPLEMTEGTLRAE